MSHFGVDSPIIDLFEDHSPLHQRQQPNGKNCEDLFDQLFRNPQQNRKQEDGQCDDDSFTVKKSMKTYARKRRPFADINQQQNFDNCDSENSDNEDDDDDDDGVSSVFSDDRPEKKDRKDARICKPKKKEKYPECTKESLLAAFQKAIEMNDLPDFEEIEKQELNIINESQVKKVKKRGRKTTATTTITDTKTKSKTVSKRTNVRSKTNNENIENLNINNIDSILSNPISSNIIETQSVTAYKTPIKSIRKPSKPEKVVVAQRRSLRTRNNKTSNMDNNNINDENLNHNNLPKNKRNGKSIVKSNENDLKNDTKLSNIFKSPMKPIDNNIPTNRVNNNNKEQDIDLTQDFRILNNKNIVSSTPKLGRGLRSKQNNTTKAKQQQQQLVSPIKSSTPLHKTKKSKDTIFSLSTSIIQVANSGKNHKITLK